MNDPTPAALGERVERALAQLRSVPATGPGVYGAPDPESGERWNAGNVLGHLAEMLSFWTRQVEAILEGASEAGRGPGGYERRRTGIDSGAALAEAELRARIESGGAALLALLGRLDRDSLERPIVYHSRGGDREITLGGFIEELLVGHLEGHAAQLSDLGRAR